jgi:hypothetical protein
MSPKLKTWGRQESKWHCPHTLVKINHVNYLAYIKVDKLQKYGFQPLILRLRGKVLTTRPFFYVM